ncbi:MAG: LPP20 family lipoprotein, partial [Flavicella sp.]
MPNNFIYFILSMIVLSCGSAKKANRQFESLPDWVKQKPQSDHSYYGLGKAPKNGFPDLYIKEAEKQALSDMAEQIETSVSSSSLRYQFDVENETSDFYMNTVKTKSDVFFEGYRVSKRYEDDNFYWNLVEITKSQFKSVNEKRKQNTLNNAYIKYNEANTYLENKEGAYKVIQSIVNSLEILKPFWNDSPIYTFKNGSELNL